MLQDTILLHYYVQTKNSVISKSHTQDINLDLHSFHVDCVHPTACSRVFVGSWVAVEFVHHFYNTCGA
jgi:hypothetical protein